VSVLALLITGHPVTVVPVGGRTLEQRASDRLAGHAEVGVVRRVALPATTGETANNAETGPEPTGPELVVAALAAADPAELAGLPADGVVIVLDPRWVAELDSRNTQNSAQDDQQDDQQDELRAVLDAVRAGADVAVPGRPVTDTLKRVDGRGRVLGTVARERYLRRGTPWVLAVQVARAGSEVLLRSLGQAELVPSSVPARFVADQVDLDLLGGPLERRAQPIAASLPISRSATGTSPG